MASAAKRKKRTTNGVVSLSDDKIDQWREEGYCVISGLLDDALMTRCTDFLYNKWDTIDKCCPGFGSINGELEFPSGQVIDHVTVNENILAYVRAFLKTDDVTLIQSDTWSKAGRKLEDYADSDHGNGINEGYSAAARSKKYSNQDQRVHMDYGNNTFLHPGDWGSPEQVTAIVYFHDTSVTEGGTGIVPRRGRDDAIYQPPYINMPGYGGYKFLNNRQAAEDYFEESHPDVAAFRKSIYERELIPKYKLGDVLFYRMDAWHRGTPVKPGSIRTVMNLAWKRQDCYWYNTWNKGFTKNMYYGVIEKLITDLSPSQRASIGFPKPGHAYWTVHTIKCLQARYPGIDATPYLASLDGGGR